MMASQRNNMGLIERLPAVRGRYQPNALLSKLTWFRVGGPAEVLYRPADLADLELFLTQKPDDVPVTVLGVGSNMLVRDGGVPGVVIRLSETFSEITTRGMRLTAGGGASNLKVANQARQSGIGGLEFLSGIPGSIGGSVRMNAGAFGREMKDVTLSAQALDDAGKLIDLGYSEFAFSYRHCNCPDDYIFVSVELEGYEAPTEEIQKRMDEIQLNRTEAQPTQTPTGGSTFTNPAGHKAWELIDSAGCRGLTRGGAAVSSKHCNFLINEGGATAADLEGLGEEVRRRVFQSSGIQLEWEIRRIGVAADPAVREVTS
ncbi:MAG: UDP-N-acetylmuramate dehydrogenase [Proteobacteria bacterium]|nr:UDP-N-acetylmuramate dehydrogenase [Pseudomonadota bacterium]